VEQLVDDSVMTGVDILMVSVLLENGKQTKWHAINELKLFTF